jgi:hypothetical protein
MADALNDAIETVPLWQRVEAGAAWLDENMPGWVDVIDLDTLDLASGCSCVLGQLAADVQQGAGYGAFRGREAKHLGLPYLTSFEAERLGFVNSKNEYDELNELWTALISRRREGSDQ